MSTIVKVGQNLGSLYLVFSEEKEVMAQRWKELKRYVREGQGNFVQIPILQDQDEMLKLIRFLVRHEVHFGLGKIYEHGGTFQIGTKRKLIKPSEFYSPSAFQELIDTAGEYYGGRLALTEAGGMLYWPRTYLIDRRENEYEPLPQVPDLPTAKRNFVSLLKRVLKKEQRYSTRSLFSVDGSMTFKYFAEAGFRTLALEAFPGDPVRMHAALRGAARAYDIDDLIVYQATQWYAGFGYDQIWLKRIKIGLHYSFAAGCSTIMGEGAMYDGFPFDRNPRHPALREYRKIFKDFYHFCQTHPRPAGKPKVSLGLCTATSTGVRDCGTLGCGASSTTTSGATDRRNRGGNWSVS